MQGLVKLLLLALLLLIETCITIALFCCSQLVSDAARWSTAIYQFVDGNVDVSVIRRFRNRSELFKPGKTATELSSVWRKKITSREFWRISEACAELLDSYPAYAATQPL